MLEIKWLSSWMVHCEDGNACSLCSVQLAQPRVGPACASYDAFASYREVEEACIIVFAE